MATDAVTASDAVSQEAAAQEAVPYPPSWVDRLIRWIEDLPGPTWLAYLIFGVLLVAASIATVATNEASDEGDLAAYAFWGAVIPLSLWLVHFLAGVAGDALDAFRPSLTVTDAEAARMRYELTVIPATPALVILIISAVFTPLYWWYDPVGSAVVGMAPWALVGRFFTETFFGSLLFVFAFQSIRQLRAVARIHSGATRVDLFRPAPLYAFSVLTSRTAIVLALLTTIPGAVAWAQADYTSTGLVLGYGLIGVAIALIVFVVPLLGMRRRITAEKRRLQSEVGKRIETTIGAVHGAVDAGDMAAAASMHDALAVLVAERDLVDKLPTFPWRPGTLGAVATAVALPIALSIASRLLERII